MRDSLPKHSFLARLKGRFLRFFARPVLLADEVERCRRWAATRSAEQRTGDWACDYVRWDIVRASAIDLLDTSPAAHFTEQHIADLLFVIARDHESDKIVNRLAEDQAALLRLAEASLASPEPDAKRRLADQLGAVSVGTSETELILVQMAGDTDEYVVRRALMALGALKSTHAEALAVRAWESGIEYHRVAALWVLKAIDSEKLPDYLAKADTDGRAHVVHNAHEIHNQGTGHR